MHRCSTLTRMSAAQLQHVRLCAAVVPPGSSRLVPATAENEERNCAVVADDVRRVPAARSRLLACGRRGAVGPARGVEPGDARQVMLVPALLLAVESQLAATEDENLVADQRRRVASSRLGRGAARARRLPRQRVEPEQKELVCGEDVRSLVHPPQIAAPHGHGGAGAGGRRGQQRRGVAVARPRLRSAGGELPPACAPHVVRTRDAVPLERSARTVARPAKYDEVAAGHAPRRLEHLLDLERFSDASLERLEGQARGEGGARPQRRGALARRRRGWRRGDEDGSVAEAAPARRRRLGAPRVRRRERD
mmetsp:Transcript_51286/g.169949  ORF Transcript_51286/g.169949 Transcript_51286/m.169949 type:complete len:308 (+) Transcript_51286:44-967(+)